MIAYRKLSSFDIYGKRGTIGYVVVLSDIHS